MFDELVGQVKRLFSTKSNGGKLVHKLTDRLHYYKQTLLATSIILLLGYSQFRDHFSCQDSGKHLDKKYLTNFCWINGTTTLESSRFKIEGGQIRANTRRRNRPHSAPFNGVDLRPIPQAPSTKSPSSFPSPSPSPSLTLSSLSSTGFSVSATSSGDPATLLTSSNSKRLATGGFPNNPLLPHVGIQFKLDGQDQPIYHNYMQSLWALLILMAICSFLAQRQWSGIFRDDTLCALLKLSGHEKMPTVIKAQEKRPYETIMALDRPKLAPEHRDRNNNANLPSLTDTIGDSAYESLEIILGDLNEHNKVLDYYCNQLIYLLLSKQPTLGLKLRRQLVHYAISSLIFTLMQFILPWFFIGHHYTLYGWHYFQEWSKFLLNQLDWTQSSDYSPSVNYHLSARIFPTSVACLYQSWGLSDLELVTVDCIVQINEICAKLFVVIWWFIAVNIVVELVASVSMLLGAFNLNTTKFTLGFRFWPNCKQEVITIATFKYRLLARLNKQQWPTNKFSRPEVANKQAYLDMGQRKKLEAEAKDISTDSGGRDVRCLRGACTSLSKMIQGICGEQTRGRYEHRACSDDPDVYFLLYLLYLRLNSSRSKTEEVICRTSEALDRYLRHLDSNGQRSAVSSQLFYPCEQQQVGQDAGAVAVDIDA